MEVTYDLTPEDAWQFNLYYRRHKAAIRPVFVYTLAGVIGIIFCAGILAVFVFWLKHQQPNWNLLFALLATAYFTARFIPPSKKRTLKLHSRRSGFVCEHTINISPEWFAERTSVNDTKIAWTTIQAIEEDHGNFYFFLSKANAHIVPKRAFSSLAEASTFLNLARRYWDAAKSQTPITAEDAAVWPPAPRPGA